MRDRIYTTGGRRLRVHHAGSAHGVQRWELQVSDRMPDRFTGLLVSLAGRIRRQNRPGEVGLGRGHTGGLTRKNPSKINAPVGLVGLVGLFHPYTCARTRAR